MLEKYLKGRPGVSVDNRSRVLRLIENMTMGRNAVGYLTESMHGAGSPQAQRIQIARSMQIEFKKQLAKKLAGINSASPEEITDDLRPTWHASSHLSETSRADPCVDTPDPRDRGVPLCSIAAHPNTR